MNMYMWKACVPMYMYMYALHTCTKYYCRDWCMYMYSLTYMYMYMTLYSHIMSTICSYTCYCHVLKLNTSFICGFFSLSLSLSLSLSHSLSHSHSHSLSLSLTHSLYLPPPPPHSASSQLIYLLQSYPHQSPSRQLPLAGRVHQWGHSNGQPWASHQRQRWGESFYSKLVIVIIVWV